MSRLTLRDGLILVFLASGAHQAAADNTALINAFGGDPGSPLPYAYDNGVPVAMGETYTLRIPVINTDIKNIFYDTVVDVAVSDKVVYRITAARAYRTLGYCNKAREIISVHLAVGLPFAVTVDPDEWQRQSADGKVVGRVRCSRRRHDPMPVLTLTIVVR